MGDPVDPSAVLPKDAPQDLRDFLSCKGATVTLKDGALPWAAGSPTIMITPDTATTATASVSKGPLSVSVPLSIANGQLSVDTSSLPDFLSTLVKESFDVENLNAWFKAHGQGLDKPRFGKGQVTLTKVPLAQLGQQAPKPTRMSVVGSPNATPVQELFTLPDGAGGEKGSESGSRTVPSETAPVHSGGGTTIPYTPTPLPTKGMSAEGGPSIAPSDAIPASSPESSEPAAPGPSGTSGTGGAPSAAFNQDRRQYEDRFPTSEPPVDSAVDTPFPLASFDGLRYLDKTRADPGLAPPPSFDVPLEVDEQPTPPELAPIGPDHGLDGSAAPTGDDVTFQVPSGGSEIQVSLQDPASPSAAGADVTFETPPAVQPSTNEPPTEPDPLSGVTVGEPTGSSPAGGDDLPAPTVASAPASPAPASPAPASPAPASPAPASPAPASPAPASSGTSVRSEADLRKLVAIVRAMTWPGSASSSSEAYLRVFVLNLLMHLYSPVGEDEAQRRLSFLIWLEIIDWWSDTPSTDEIAAAAELEGMWAEDGDGSPSLQGQGTNPSLRTMHDEWVRAVVDDRPTFLNDTVLRRAAPIDSTTSTATWPDFPDALIDDWDRISNPPVHSAIHDLSGESGEPTAATPPDGESDESPVATEASWQDIWTQFQVYLQTDFGGGWTQARLDDPAGSQQAFALFGRFMSWAYGADWQEHEYEIEEEGGRASEYISSYFASGTAAEQTAAAEDDDKEPPTDAAYLILASPQPHPADVPPPQFMGVLAGQPDDGDDQAPTDAAYPILASPQPHPADVPPPQFMGVLGDHRSGEGVGEAAPEESQPSIEDATGVIVQADDHADEAEEALAATAAGQPASATAAATRASSGPNRTFIGAGVAVLVVILIAALALVAHPFGPASLTGSGTNPGGTTPTGGTGASGSATAGPPAGGSGLPTSGLTLNGGAAETGAALLANPQGGCAGFTGGATSPSDLDVANGSVILSILSAGSLPMLGTISADGSFSLVNGDGSSKATGMLGPTGMSGTLTVTRSGCTETVQFSIALGSSGGGVTTPTTQPSFPSSTFVAIIIDHNLISFGTKAIDFCHQPYVVTFSYRINGIGPDTPVVIEQTGPETPSGPKTYHLTGGVEFSVSYDDPGGPGVWTSDILTINGAPPPFPSGAHGSTSINC